MNKINLQNRAYLGNAETRWELSNKMIILLGIFFGIEYFTFTEYYS